MRAAFYGCFLTALLATTLGAQSTPASGALQPLKLPEMAPVPARPTAELDAALFFPQHPVADPDTALPGETRSVAQLDALLATYVGTWRGTSTWDNLSTHQAVTLPTELDYQLQKQNGHNALSCAITYRIQGSTIIALSRLWIENNHIFSETTQNGISHKYVAQSRGSSLEWRTYGSLQTLFDFVEIETLRLTPDGGEISSHGFEFQHGATADSIVLESTDLKLMK